MGNGSTNLISLQFALFFQDIVSRPDNEFGDLNANLMNIFDAIPTTIPTPMEMPDAPVMMLRSESNEYACNIARSRIDLHFQRVSNKKTNEELVLDFNAKIIGMIRYILNKKDIIRFGMISRYFHESSNAVEDIKSKYFKDEIGQVAELSLRFNKQDSIEDWIINDMVDIMAAEIMMDNTKQKGVLIQRDINNNPVDGVILTEELLKSISSSYSQRMTTKSVKELL